MTQGHERGAPALIHVNLFDQCSLTVIPESIGCLGNLISAFIKIRFNRRNSIFLRFLQCLMYTLKNKNPKLVQMVLRFIKSNRNYSHTSIARGDQHWSRADAKLYWQHDKPDAHGSKANFH